MSMWRQLRKSKGYTLEEYGRKIGYSKQMLSKCEIGTVPMPIKLQIEYLKLRNNEKDKIIIEYLKEMLKNGK